MHIIHRNTYMSIFIEHLNVAQCDLIPIIVANTAASLFKLIFKKYLNRKFIRKLPFL